MATVEYIRVRYDIPGGGVKHFVVAIDEVATSHTVYAESNSSGNVGAIRDALNSAL